MSTPIPEIIIRETIPVKGRGNVHLAHGEDNPGINLTKLAGQAVRIKGIAYMVCSVECTEKNGIVQNYVGLVVRPWAAP